MPRDASLDAFVSTSAADESDDEDASRSDSVAVGQSDTVRITADWDPDGVACERCGRDVERRWREGDLLVCAGCKEWHQE